MEFRVTEKEEQVVDWVLIRYTGVKLGKQLPTLSRSLHIAQEFCMMLGKGIQYLNLDFLNAVKNSLFST